MTVNSLVLAVGQGINTLLKLSAFVLLLHAYVSYKRKSALFWSLAFLVDALSIVSDIVSEQYGLAIFQALAVSLLFYGAFILLEEEGMSPSQPYIKNIAGLAPLILTLYIITYYALKEGANPSFDELALMYGIAGFFHFFTGALLFGLHGVYMKRGTYLAAAFMIYGIHKMDYPFLRPVEWFAPIGFILGALFTLFEVVLVLVVVSSDEFRNLNRPVSQVDFKEGVMIISPREYPKIKEHLRDAPVLAFLRKVKEAPENWEVYFITKVAGYRSISPTEPEKIVELSCRYLIEAKKKGISGVILLDCIEYLRAYNEFISIAKFLSALKDYITVYGGTLVLVIDSTAWDEKEMGMLKRVLGVEV
ncbi:DUF835 domain-containing protein [Palaeococcus pacificus]|nr:DUF835 domain-containing protein [Palaeococcus pacificus]